MKRPSNNPLTPGYGFGSTLEPYTASNPHKGVDFRYNPDHNIYAPEAGRIELINRPSNGDCGNTIRLYKDNRRHTFCHIADGGFKVSNNQQVDEGQIIGVMGGTGTTANQYSAHLHWVLTIDGKLVDPLKYVNNEGGEIMEKFKDANDVRVNGWGLFGYDEPGSINGAPNPDLTVWVGKPKLDFFKGLGAQVVNDRKVLNQTIADLQKDDNQCTAEERALLDLLKKVTK